MTTNEKIDFVALILDENMSSDKFTFINALLKSIEINKLIQIYWDAIEKQINPIVDVIQYQLVKRLIEDKGETLHILIDQTINEIKSNKYRQLRKVRSLLTQSIQHLADYHRVKVFNTFILDEIKGNRKLAYKSISGLVNNDVEKKLFESWKENYDKECLILLINESKFIKNSSSDYLEELLNFDNIEDWIKRKVLLELGLRNTSYIEYLKDENPTTYLYIASENKIDVPGKWILNKINTLSSPEELTVFIYSIGSLNKINLLKVIYEKYEEIQKQMFKKCFDI